MGQDADRKVTEIREAREQLDRDLRELEERLPAPARLAKRAVAVVVGSGVIGGIAMRALRKRKQRAPAAEVVIRVVDDRDRRDRSRA
ncbi:MAG: DUF3618 domain-containing protein [Candidatus Velamenicoccus archaeovorus]